MPVAGAALLMLVLIGPALFVLLTRDGGEDRPEAVAVARLPTDVAVDGDTVWVASGRDDRILAIDAAAPDDPPARHETGSAPLRVAVGAGTVWTANAGDGQRFRPIVAAAVARQQHEQGGTDQDQDKHRSGRHGHPAGTALRCVGHCHWRSSPSVPGSRVAGTGALITASCGLYPGWWRRAYACSCGAQR